jgi:hypothetical protein
MGRCKNFTDYRVSYELTDPDKRNSAGVSQLFWVLACEGWCELPEQESAWVGQVLARHNIYVMSSGVLDVADATSCSSDGTGRALASRAALNPHDALTLPRDNPGRAMRAQRLIAAFESVRSGGIAFR